MELDFERFRGPLHLQDLHERPDGARVVVAEDGDVAAQPHHGREVQRSVAWEGGEIRLKTEIVRGQTFPRARSTSAT